MSELPEKTYGRYAILPQLSRIVFIVHFLYNVISFGCFPDICVDIQKLVLSTTAFLAVVGSALSEAPAEFRTPLRYDWDNRLAVNVSIANSA